MMESPPSRLSTNESSKGKEPVQDTMLESNHAKGSPQVETAPSLFSWRDSGRTLVSRPSTPSLLRLLWAHCTAPQARKDT